MSELKNLIIAMLAALVILFGWQYFYEMPRMKQKQEENVRIEQEKAKPKREENIGLLSIDEALRSSGPRVNIKSTAINGSISLVGARVDNLILNKYKESVDENSKSITLLSPARTSNAYFAEFGWLSKDSNLSMPNAKTLWSANKSTLTANDKVILSWQNGQGILFQIEIALDENYLFTVTQSIKNNTNSAISFQTYGLVNRIHSSKDKMYISHEGPIGVFNKILKETSYDDLEKKGKIVLPANNPGSWIGISDKYWLVSLIPDHSQNFDAQLQYNRSQDAKKFQVDFLTPEQILQPKSQSTYTNHLFAGAKVLSILDKLKDQLNLDLFDRAIDFGWFYFITKPMFYALKYFYDVVGNFGLSIIIVTIIVKIVLFPLANKSFHSMSKMKKIQPQVTALREKYADDKMKQNQAIMDLYKKEKVSPLSGCLPMLVQIPIFFSLYKVLFVTIEMNHAPFLWWIKDLSAPDPTSIFNLFGLIPWTPPSFLMIGVWPIIMALTMYLQQRLNPEPSDPAQAQVMKFLPLIFLFMFSSFPSGLVIYWAWSNTLSIIQQYLILYRVNKLA